MRLPEETLHLSEQDQRQEATGTLDMEAKDPGLLGALDRVLVIGLLEALGLEMLALETLESLDTEVSDQIAQAMEAPGLPTQTGVHLKRFQEM